MPAVENVHVTDMGETGRRYCAVLSERDYEAMDKIYEIEEDMLSRFPESNIDFRVTVSERE
jgi:hypothetical protein